MSDALTVIARPATIVKQSPTTGYSLAQIVLHWTIAALILFQLVFGESMAEVVEAAEEGKTASAFDQSMASAHFWVGIAVLALVIVRLSLRVFQGVPALVASSGTLANRAARVTHWLFYALLFLVPVTGLLATYVSEGFGEIHELGKPAFIGLIALHAAGALYHHFWLKDGTLRRMLTPAK